MIKALMFSAAIVTGAASLAQTGMAQTIRPGQDASPRAQLYANDGFIDNHYAPGNTGVAVDGRCGGVSYGTGQRGCGTATGGPVGGNPSRN